MSRRINQLELPGAEGVFNLVSETTSDGFRETLNRLHEAERQAAARQYELKMQRTFAECPGFIGGDAPEQPGRIGHVVVESGWIGEALPWLRRRFVVNQSMEFEAASCGLRVEIMTRPERKKGGYPKRIRLVFKKAEQFDLFTDRE